MDLEKYNEKMRDYYASNKDAIGDRRRIKRYANLGVPEGLIEEFEANRKIYNMIRDNKLSFELLSNFLKKYENITVQ